MSRGFCRLFAARCGPRHQLDTLDADTSHTIKFITYKQLSDITYSL